MKRRIVGRGRGHFPATVLPRACHRRGRPTSAVLPRAGQGARSAQLIGLLQMDLRSNKACHPFGFISMRLPLSTPALLNVAWPAGPSAANDASDPSETLTHRFDSRVLSITGQRNLRGPGDFNCRNHRVFARDLET